MATATRADGPESGRRPNVNDAGIERVYRSRTRARDSTLGVRVRAARLEVASASSLITSTASRNRYPEPSELGCGACFRLRLLALRRGFGFGEVMAGGEAGGEIPAAAEVSATSHVRSSCAA